MAVGLFPADGQIETVVANPAGKHGGAEHDHRAGRFGLALKGKHQRMAVDDTGRGGQQSGNAPQRRFEPLRLARREPLQIIDAVRPGRIGDTFDADDLTLFSSYDQLANLGMRDSMLAAIGVKALAPGDTAACLQAAGRIIKPTMNYLAVARRGLKPDR